MQSQCCITFANAVKWTFCWLFLFRQFCSELQTENVNTILFASDNYYWQGPLIWATVVNFQVNCNIKIIQQKSTFPWFINLLSIGFILSSREKLWEKKMKWSEPNQVSLTRRCWNGLSLHYYTVLHCFTINIAKRSGEDFSFFCDLINITSFSFPYRAWNLP